MDPKSEDEIHEMMEEFSEDLNRSHNMENNLQRQKLASGHTFQGNPILWSSIGVAIILSLFALFFNDGSSALKKEFATVKDRIDQVEKKVIALEERLTEKNPLSTQIKGVKKTITTLSKSQKTSNNLTNKLSTKVTALEKEIKSIKDDLKNLTVKNVKPVSPANMRKHIVRKGETLYRISQKYNIPVNELLRLNNLKKDQDIYPGQKLIFPPVKVE